MRTRIERTVDVAAPAGEVWDYVTDWPRQQEWIPQTHVENVDEARGLGGRFRAWSGIGRVGFWDPMTITAWTRSADGGGTCEVLHRGRVVKGEGEFAVVARGARFGDPARVRAAVQSRAAGDRLLQAAERST